MCEKCYAKQWYQANKSRLKAYGQKRYASDRERYRKKSRDWELANPGKIRGYKVSRWARKCLFAARASSKRRGHLPPQISEQFILDLYEKQQRRCYWSGVEMLPEFLRHAPLQPSLERLDNERGYEPGNVVLACYCLNRARRDLAEEVFESALVAIGAALQIKYADRYRKSEDSPTAGVSGFLEIPEHAA